MQFLIELVSSPRVPDPFQVKKPLTGNTSVPIQASSILQCNFTCKASPPASSYKGVEG